MQLIEELSFPVITIPYLVARGRVRWRFLDFERQSWQHHLPCERKFR
jgi:hypothetical protein